MNNLALECLQDIYLYVNLHWCWKCKLVYGFNERFTDNKDENFNLISFVCEKCKTGKHHEGNNRI